MSFVDRFWSRVIKTEDCWYWAGYVNPNGYATVYVLPKKEYVHRVSYELANGKIPEGLVIDHLCGNKICVNPVHLEAVTQKENVHRSLDPFCANGHEKTPDNVYLRASGKRECRVCCRERSRRYYHATKVY